MGMISPEYSLRNLWFWTYTWWKFYVVDFKWVLFESFCIWCLLLFVSIFYSQSLKFLGIVCHEIYFMFLQYFVSIKLWLVYLGYSIIHRHPTGCILKHKSCKHLWMKLETKTRILGKGVLLKTVKQNRVWGRCTSSVQNKNHLLVNSSFFWCDSIETIQFNLIMTIQFNYDSWVLFRPGGYAFSQEEGARVGQVSLW